ncbi:UNVERIFIED_CONTAM: hypothetical protein K2H54_011146 [Gekko kuhli]
MSGVVHCFSRGSPIHCLVIQESLGTCPPYQSPEDASQTSHWELSEEAGGGGGWLQRRNGQLKRSVEETAAVAEHFGDDRVLMKT